MTLPIRKHFNRVLIGGLILYAGSFAALLRNKNFESGGAVIVLALFGILLPALAWLATKRAVPLAISAHPSTREMIVLSGCIIALSIYLIGGPQWIDTHVPEAWVGSAQIKFFLTLAKKVIVFVLIPFGIFRFGFGYRLRDFGLQREGLRALGGNQLPVVICVGLRVTGLSILCGRRGCASPTGEIHG